MSLPEPIPPGTVYAGQFRIVRPFAQGGMGTIYHAEQLATGHPRALKVMHPQLAADPRARERFIQEAQAAARIESEHVVQVVAAGVDPAAGTPWIAMEFLQGEDLATAMARRGRFPPAEVVEIYRQLGHAMAAAHRAGIIHRDLKPENVFVASARRSDASFTAKVLDFGIAKWLQENRPAGNTTVIGSPPWMAPEQLDTRGMISPAADQWPLGLMAFALLTGQPYWIAANPQRFSFPQLLVEVGSAQYVPASQRAQELGVPNGVIPPAFDAWLGRCLARDPSQRWRDVSELVTALVAALQPQPAAAPIGATMAIPMSQIPGGLSGTMAIPSMATPLQGSIPSPASGPFGAPAQAPYGAPAQAPYGAQSPYGAPVPGPFGPAGSAALPGTPGWQYTPAPKAGGAAKSSGGGVVIALVIACVAVPALGAVGYFATRTSCDEGQHDSHGHCCGRDLEWDASQRACTGSGSVVTTVPDAGVVAPVQPVPVAPIRPDFPVVPAQPSITPMPSVAAPSTSPPGDPDEPMPNPCVGSWSGLITENTGARGSMALDVTDTTGTCARWSESWSTSGARCQYTLTRCTELSDGTLRGVGVSSSPGCTSPVQASVRCDNAQARFREAVSGTGVVDVARLSHR